MLQKAIRRAYSSKAVQQGVGAADNYERVRMNPSLIKKYTGPNSNVASHNVERRVQYKEEFSFWTSANIGVEGFSHCHIAQDMDPYSGNRNEWMWLLGILVLVPILAQGRKSNEDGIANKLSSATNRYSRMHLDSSSAQLDTSVQAMPPMSFWAAYSQVKQNDRIRKMQKE